MFEFAGGEPAFMALAEAHHQRCLQDKALSHAFAPEHVRQLATYWGEVLGSPPLYTQLYGDQSRMLQFHAGQGADEEFHRVSEAEMGQLHGRGAQAISVIRAALADRGMSLRNRTIPGVYSRVAARLLAFAAGIWHKWLIDAPAKRSLTGYRLRPLNRP